MTEKMMLFCEEYLKDKELNASAAYKRVYKTCKADMTARSNASKLLKRPDVREYIQKSKPKYTIKTQRTSRRSRSTSLR